MRKEAAAQKGCGCPMQCCTLKNAAETADAVRRKAGGVGGKDVALKVFSMFFIFILAKRSRADT